MNDVAVYTVKKRCYLCGTEWEGSAFTKQPENATALPGTCAACLAKEDARMAELLKQGPVRESGELPELVRPVRPPDEDEDELHLGRRTYIRKRPEDDEMDRLRLASGER